MAAAEAEPAEAELLHFAAVGDNGGVQSLLKAGGRINAVVRTAPWASATSVRSTARSDWKRAITRTKLGQAAGGARTKLNARPAARPAASRSTAAPKAGKNRQRDRAAWLRKAESDAKSAARKRGTPDAWEELMIEMPPHLLSAQEIEARSFVASVPMFDGLDGAFVNMLAKGLETREFQPGEILFEKGSEGDDMFFVRDGSVDVLLDLDDPPVATRGKDTFFGEVRVLLFPVPAQRCSLANPKDCRWRCSTTAHEMLTYAPMPRPASNATPSRSRAWTRSSADSPVCKEALSVAHGL